MNIQSAVPKGVAKPADTLPITHTLAAFATDTEHDAIPAAVRSRALHHMLDAAGIAQASTRYDFAHKTLAGLMGLAGKGDVPVFGMPAKLPPRDAATMNGFLCHGLDFDDTHIAGVIHPTASVFPAVLSAAHHACADACTMVTAYVLGIEVAARIGACAKGAFHQVGFHPTGMIGVFACALAAGRIMGLNQKQLVAAQGLALSMAAGSLQFLEDGAWNKRFHPGWAASSGMTAAALAREGFVGATAPYDGRFGLFNAYLGPLSADVDLSLATEGLGEVWELMNTAIKPFPTCHFTHGCIDAALALRDQIDDLAQIDSIDALVPEEAIKTICEPELNKKRPKNDYDAKFSVQFLVAAALMKGRLTLDELEPDVLNDPDILALTQKVAYCIDPESAFPKAYSGEVVIRLSDGRSLSHREHINRGAADRPLTNDEIVAKFRDNAAMVVDRATVERQIAAMLALDSDDVGAEALRVFSPAAA